MKDGDGLVYRGKLYIRRSSTRADVRDESEEGTGWKLAVDIPELARRALWPEKYQEEGTDK